MFCSNRNCASSLCLLHLQTNVVFIVKNTSAYWRCAKQSNNNNNNNNNNNTVSNNKEKRASNFTNSQWETLYHQNRNYGFNSANNTRSSEVQPWYPDIRCSLLWREVPVPPPRLREPILHTEAAVRPKVCWRFGALNMPFRAPNPKSELHNLREQLLLITPVCVLSNLTWRSAAAPLWSLVRTLLRAARLVMSLITGLCELMLAHRLWGTYFGFNVRLTLRPSPCTLWVLSLNQTELWFKERNKFPFGSNKE